MNNNQKNKSGINNLFDKNLPSNKNFLPNPLASQIPYDEARRREDMNRNQGHGSQFNSTYQRNNNERNSHSGDDDRTGMSTRAWSYSLKIADFIGDLVKSIMFIGGIISSNLADFLMGSLGISLITSASIATRTFVNPFGFGAILSLGLSSVQIYMWSLIQRRRLSIKDFFFDWKGKRIPDDIKDFVSIARVLWLFDTILDISPLFALLVNNTYQSIPFVFYILATIVFIVTFVLCGFAEILTSNMKKMMAGK